MEYHFESCSGCSIPKMEIGSGVKFYARVSEFLPDDSSRILVEDRLSAVVVDSTTLESVVCEPGEWYRFLGEFVGEFKFGDSSFPEVRLHVAPRVADGFEGEIYDRALHLRSEFLNGFDSLVAYAYRTR